MAYIPPVDLYSLVEIVESNSVIATRVKRALRGRMNAVFSKASKIIDSGLTTRVSQWIIDSPEIQSVLSGSLRGDFGIVSPAESVAEIVKAIERSVVIEWLPLNAALEGIALNIKVQPSDLANVLNAVSPVVTKKGESLPWIEWLLLAGDSPVVMNYHVEEGDFGITGQAHMVRGGSYRVGRVNPSFSGTIEDNFITRALSGKEFEIGNILADSLEKGK
jgi:hypothetical protein